MRRFLAGAATGAVIVGLLAASLGSIALEEKEKFGRHQGQVDGLLHAVDAIKREFGETPSRSELSVVFQVKDAHVVSVVVDGVRTIRVLR